jgi:hypothetical protein
MNAVAPPPLIREWHAMAPYEQAAEWKELVEWVVWIHDLYELSREERLPLCWVQHPGLVEELRSLKAWRTIIYNSPDSAAAAHTARSWHGELRQTIAAAATFWAPSCRAGHTDAKMLDAPHLVQSWLGAGAPVIASSPVSPIPLSGVGVSGVLSDAQMAAALESGTATVHSRSTPYYAQLDTAWWTRSSDGATWLPCVDPGHQAELDASAARMRAAEGALDQLRQQ